MIGSTSPPSEPSFLEQMKVFTKFEGIPTREAFVDILTGMATLQCVLLIAVGVVYLLFGWQTFKALVVINAGVLGALAGSFLGRALDGPNTQVIGAIAGALMFSVLSWPLMKYAVALMGGLAGSFVGYGVWNYIAGMSSNPDLANHAWVGALMGLVVVGMLAFVIFRETIIIFTAVQGAVLGISGLLAILLKFPSIRDSLHRSLLENTHLLLVLIAVPVVIGLACQHTGAAKKAKKKAKPAAG